MLNLLRNIFVIAGLIIITSEVVNYLSTDYRDHHPVQSVAFNETGQVIYQWLDTGLRALAMDSLSLALSHRYQTLIVLMRISSID